MKILDSLPIVFWLIFIAYWMISAIGVKKDVRSQSFKKDVMLRFGTFIVFIIFFIAFSRIISAANQYGNYPQWFTTPSLTLHIIGVMLCGAGIAFAIWARRHLGTNWSPRPAVKEGHELVTSGPYAYVRHPIYTGVLVALFGTALATGIFWGLFFLAILVTFIWRIGVEESYMMRLFPNTYPEYKKRTKALIPLVW